MSGVQRTSAQIEPSKENDLRAVKNMGKGMVERYGDRPGRESNEPAFTIRASAGGTEPGGFRWQAEESDMNYPPIWDDRPATTVANDARIAGPGRSEFVKGGVSRQDRPGSVKVTVEEAATLQSYPSPQRPEAFPDGFHWVGPKTKQYMQIGNAVPPLQAQVVFESLWADAPAVIPARAVITPAQPDQYGLAA